MNKKFIKKEITDEMRQRAEKRSKTYFDITKGRGTLLKDIHKKIQIVGFSAEEVVKHAYPELVYADDFDDKWNPENCDLSYDFIYNGKKIEVKAKSTGTVPQPWYEAEVMAYQKNRDVDIFVFLRVSQDYKTAWILGFIPSSEFFENAHLFKKGDKNQNYTYDNDRYSIKLQQLHSPYELVNYLEQQ